MSCLFVLQHDNLEGIQRHVNKFVLNQMKLDVINSTTMTTVEVS